MIRFLFSSISLFLLYSCTNPNDIAKYKIFRYNESSNITSLDPAFCHTQNNIWVVNQIFNKLVELDDSLNITADIAKQWTISKDALTYTFTLKKNVFFHKHHIFGKDSTRRVISEDVVYSLQRLTDPKVASPGGWVMKNVKHFKIINDSILEIHLKKPFASFLGLLCSEYCNIVPKEIIEYYGEAFSSNPIGTGPFVFKIWKKNTKIVLLKNPLYHERDNKGNPLPYLDAINISFLPDKQSEFLEFVKGKIDMLNSIHNSYKNELIDHKGNLSESYSTDIQMMTIPYLNTEYIGFYLDGENPLLQSLYFRQALNYAIDRKRIVQYLRNGLGTPASTGFIPKGMQGSSTKKYYPYNPKKARELLKQHRNKYPNIPLEIAISTDGSYLDICEYLQSEFQKIGVKTSIDLMTSATLKESKSKGKVDVFRASWIADYPDAENYLSLFYSKNKTPLGPNYTHFSNAIYDNYYEKSLLETNIKKRLSLYQKMDSIIMKEAPVIPIYYDQAIRFTYKNISGMSINPINLLDLKRVDILPTSN